MPHNKSHHFVPQFYLRNFASDPPARRHVRLFQIAKRRHVAHAKIKGQCARDYLYGKSGVEERALAGVEDVAAHVVRQVVGSRLVPEPNTPEFAQLLTFVFLQSARTLAAGEKYELMTGALVRQIAHSDGRISGIATPEEIEKVGVRLEDPVRLAMHAIAEAIPVADDLRMKLLVNDTPFDFITSDAPVVIHNQWAERSGEQGFGSAGLACRGLQVFLPLSPRHLLVLFDPDIYAIDPSLDDVVSVAAETDVAAFNATQMVVATENLYYADARSERHVEELDSRPRGREKTVAADRAPGADRSSSLLRVANLPLPIRFRASLMRVRDEAVAVPHRERIRQFRPEALEMAKVIEAVRAQRGATKRPRGR